MSEIGRFAWWGPLRFPITMFSLSVLNNVWLYRWNSRKFGIVLETWVCEVRVLLMVLRSVHRCMAWYQCNAEGIIESGGMVRGSSSRNRNLLSLGNSEKVRKWTIRHINCIQIALRIDFYTGSTWSNHNNYLVFSSHGIFR